MQRLSVLSEEQLDEIKTTLEPLVGVKDKLSNGMLADFVKNMQQVKFPDDFSFSSPRSSRELTEGFPALNRATR